jgi:hypothetical protein
MRIWLDNLTGSLLIVSRTEVQLDAFCRNQHIPKDRVCRITSTDNLRGMNVDRPLVLLPDTIQDQKMKEAVAEWFYRDGTFVIIDEAMVLGRKPLCPEDTDGDGNCHLCAKHGGCTWPDLAGPVLRVKEHARKIIRRHDGLFKKLAE